ncbi:glyceraldehyde dehydrogenase subunit beta [Sulfolobus acidocaldarius]|uniref:Glyceraldehyde dehydrogenase medium chain n=4 Tax=Sulfolobus acidocaldarius TaxID=2285 RepID=CUTB_SULAC|nr:glyceraldehyde dehydrogenase subunit beta [Sulfolobus acidocaldarius]Q4J6M6.1 RecName: Full=Glyceraldehyde dehydrogenase medium chain; AltName: Full=Glyceraldehyde dehydrogenase subunit B; AltName: Full=Glyceraldehyde dehydrogenase subunit beta [Sulfolobus acidocaldarius DSM 639]AAY81555.1 carbon monoxide dehydrogenase medium chain [Sulfolobus acidocaldarius DSM 639]AGE72158.1 carbon monoxide dehydrogenase medium chain [Sulfolobus acidocaldarius N8]AGE74475.1 carbon monoxide dehydrogenase me
MYPPEFSYVRAESLQEALKFLEGNDNTRPLAGGQSLIPMLKLRVLSPDYILDINRLNELNYVKTSLNGVSIGALTRYHDILSNDIVKSKVPLMHHATRTIGDMQVRNMGTIGGAISNADPASDMPVVLTALNATIILSSASGSRSVKALDFFKGPFTTDTNKGELVTQIEVPVLDGYKTVYKKVVRRAGDYALASVALAIKLKGNEIEDIKLAYGGVHDKPFRAMEVEKNVIGKKLNDDLVKDIASKVSSQINPPSDHRGSSWYRREVVKVLTMKAFKEVA